MTMDLPNLARRIAYRLGYPLARAWWWARRPAAEGVAVAVLAENKVLVVRQSFRAGLGLVGGGRAPGEDPRLAAARELAEEVELVVAAEQLRPAGRIGLVHEHRSLQVDLFELALPSRPVVTPDGAEVIAAAWMSPDHLLGRADLHPVLTSWLQARGR